ncbi:hypothetical protein [Kitasatospora indigofera]|uniref:hypothetical protein n=1 Tax=Kitasatospora indigofera TaxID=67307 RepID=UPI0036C411DE
MTRYAKVHDSEDVAELRRQIEPLVGSPVSRVLLSEGGSLGVHFDTVGSALGCRLWIYTVAWRVDGRDAVLAASQDPSEGLEEALGALEGQRLVGVDIKSLSLDTTFTFTEHTLRVFPVFFRSDDEDALYWTLRLPTRHLLGAGPGASWSVRRPLSAKADG